MGDVGDVSTHREESGHISPPGDMATDGSEKKWQSDRSWY